MKKLFFILIILFSVYLYAGDYRYEWANFGRFGLGEIDNQLIIYCGYDTCITHIPSFISYWKRYILGVIMIFFIVKFFKKKKSLK